MGWGLTLHAWGSVLAATAIYFIWPNPFTFILAVMLIGSRQLGMAILSHDAAHRALFKSPKLNDFMGHYVLGLPYGGNLHNYRAYHLRHHKHAQRPNDPDLGLSSKFPVTRNSLARKFLRDLSGLTALKLRFGQVMMGFKNQQGDKGEDNVFAQSALLQTILVNIGMWFVLHLFGIGWAYFAFWLLPLFTWFQLVLRIRNIAEHALTTQDDNPLTHARTTKANVLERIFIAPYWVNYHIEHHAYMFVPCFNLPRLHKAFLDQGLEAEMEIKPNYVAMLSAASAKTSAS